MSVRFGSQSSSFRITFYYFLDRNLVLFGCRSQYLGIADGILVPPSFKPKELEFANKILIYASNQKLKHANLVEIIKCSELLKALNSDDLV